MLGERINLAERFSRFQDHWAPKVIAEMNDYQFKLVKLAGEFTWHAHAETDEAFLVVEGEMQILFRDGSVSLSAGEMFVVPKGVEHKPCADVECHAMVIEPRGVVNTGDAPGELTAPHDVWI